MKNIISFPLLKENFKRYWICSAIVFVLYFLGTNFIILEEYDNLGWYDVSPMLSCSYIVYTVLDICVPIVACAIMFSYLGKTGSTGVIHSLPFSRTGLFVTNYLSGFILSMLPVVINSIIMLLIKKSVGLSVWSGSLYMQTENTFTTGTIFSVMLFNILAILFTYSISTLAAMISGNTVIHILTSVALCFLLPVFILTFDGYADRYFYGYTYNGIFGNAAINMHPSLAVYGSNFNSLSLFIYFAVSIVLTIAALILYQNRKLERASDSYVFVWVKYIIAFFFVYFPATVFGLILGEDHGFVTGLVIGGAVGFVIGWMIINKSFKIINVKSAGAFICCIAAVLIVVLAFMLDITGFEKRVPDAADVESVTYSSSYISDGCQQTVKDSDKIERLADLHKSLVEDRKDWAAGDSSDCSYDTICDFLIEYKLKNGRTLKRYYWNINSDMLASYSDI